MSAAADHFEEWASEALSAAKRNLGESADLHLDVAAELLSLANHVRRPRVAQGGASIQVHISPDVAIVPVPVVGPMVMRYA